MELPEGSLPLPACVARSFLRGSDGWELEIRFPGHSACYLLNDLGAASSVLPSDIVCLFGLQAPTRTRENSPLKNAPLVRLRPLPLSARDGCVKLRGRQVRVEVVKKK